MLTNIVQVQLAEVCYLLLQVRNLGFKLQLRRHHQLLSLLLVFQLTLILGFLSFDLVRVLGFLSFDLVRVLGFLSFDFVLKELTLFPQLGSPLGNLVGTHLLLLCQLQGQPLDLFVFQLTRRFQFKNLFLQMRN